MHNHYVPTIIVDRDSLFRVGVMHTLSETRFRVTAEYSTFGEVLSDDIVPTISLLLISLDDLIHQSIDEFRQFRRNHGNFHVALLGKNANEQEVRVTVDFCGECYVLKNAINPEILLQSLELVMSGQSVFTHEFMRVLQSGCRVVAAPLPLESPLDTAQEVQRELAPIDDGPLACRLSGRETAILMRLMHGASNKVIARELDIAEATVKVHVKSVLRKVRVKNRTQAATWAWSRCSQRVAPAERFNGGELGDGIVTESGLSQGGASGGGLRTEPTQSTAAVPLTVELAGN
jgi:two-component system nitrate/nitrite response regulator NarL